MVEAWVAGIWAAEDWEVEAVVVAAKALDISEEGEKEEREEGWKEDGEEDGDEEREEVEEVEKVEKVLNSSITEWTLLALLEPRCLEPPGLAN